MSDQRIPCECGGCPCDADWEISPASARHKTRHDALSILLCDNHHTAAQAIKQPREELYRSANRLVRTTLTDQRLR